MTKNTSAIQQPWVPAGCTLPTLDQPMRQEQFDDLFQTAVRSVDRVGTGHARLDLVPEPAVASRAADLAMREAGCCSFFTFTLSVSGEQLGLDIVVPPDRQAVLDALLRRVLSLMSKAAPSLTP